MTENTNAAWFERAQAVIPGGVDSPVRSFSSVGGVPYTVVSGSGAWVEDIEGTRYRDFVQSYGASLLGHADPRVIGVIRDAAVKGTTFGASPLCLLRHRSSDVGGAGCSRSHGPKQDIEV